MNINIDNLFVLARRARANGDNNAAARYYEQILLVYPNNWEAVFYNDYCIAASCIVRDIAPSAQRVKKAFNTAFYLVVNSNLPNKTEILYEMCDNSNILLNKLSDTAHYYFIQNFNVGGVEIEYMNMVYECGMATCLIGDRFYDIGDKRVATICYKKAPIFWRGHYKLNDLAINRIREYDPDYLTSTPPRPAPPPSQSTAPPSSPKQDMFALWFFVIVIFLVVIFIAMIR